MTESPPTLLISEAQIAARVAELARQIDRDYAGRELVLVGVLRGAFIFLADLARRLTIPHRVDFIALSRYEHGAVPSDDVRLGMDLREPITGRHVLIVEDILDSGVTLTYLLRLLAARSPASLKTCVLTRKLGKLKSEATLDYVGFEIPDGWVVGYGLDYDNRWRTLPYIGILPPGTP